MIARPKDKLTTCPDSRLSRPTRLTTEGARVINIDNYAPYFFAAINSALSRGASARYLNDFGIGVTEWRVLSWIATEPQVSAARICDVIALDKAAVSRAVAKLENDALIAATPSRRDPRRKALRLTAAGAVLHDRVLTAALEREAQLIDGVPPEDYETFLRVMRRLRANVETL